MTTQADGAPADGSPADVGSHARTRLDRGRLGRIGLEIAAAVLPAIAFTAWARTIDVNPMTRVGQVSGMATLQFRFAICAALLAVVMFAFHRFGSESARSLAIRLGCAAAAGLATGLVAGGMVVALRGTPWALWAGAADYTPLIQALQTHDLRNLPAHYPPLFPTLMGAWAFISDQPLTYGLQDLQFLGTAMFGPAAYLSWRMVLKPQWALAIGVVAMFPFIEPVKPYPQITLIMFVPVVVALLRALRHSAGLTLARAALIGAGFGVMLGLLFLLYSGWFVWCAPGVLLAAAILIPWRAGYRPALVLGGAATLAFVAVAFVHLRGLFNSTGGVSDAYFYFDTCSDPAYIAMWRNDRPYGAGPIWPPLGELGGVGLFTVLLAAGAGLAVLLAWRRTIVVAIGFCIAGAWFIRMWLAGEMYATETVRLYPRTTMVVLYGLLLLTGLAVYFVAEAVKRLVAQHRDAGSQSRLAPTALALIPLMFLFASAGSATIDKYMPSMRADGNGYFAWIAQTYRTYEGWCSPYAGDLCGATAIEDKTPQCGPGLAPPTRPRSLGRLAEITPVADPTLAALS